MLWLTMIVKNEAPRMLRALASAVAGGVTHAVVLDTGSTDGTHEAAKQAAEALGLPLTWHTGPFRDFSQARNLALDHLLREARRQRIAPGDLCVLSLDADEELACPLADILAMAPRADGYLLPTYARASQRRYSRCCAPAALGATEAWCTRQRRAPKPSS